MTVTPDPVGLPLRVEACERCPDGRWSLRAGGREIARLYADSLAECRLGPGAELDAASWRQLQELAARDAARADALRLLSARERTSSELARRLRARGHDPRAVVAALEVLERQGLLDDEALARRIARERLARRPQAPGMVAAALERRGVDRASAGAAARAAAEEAGGPRELARRALDAMLGHRGPERPVDRRELARLAARLRRRGFAWETVQLVLRERFPAAVGAEGWPDEGGSP